MKKVIGYVNTNDLAKVTGQDAACMDVINIAFGGILEGKAVWNAGTAAKELKRIREYHPEIRIVLSVGGWGADGFSEAAATKESREKFAGSALDLVKTYDLDGIDIDWEYPGTSLAGIASDVKDGENYVLFLQALRSVLDGYREGMLLTAAVGGDAYFAKLTDMNAVGQILDYVQLMTYDLQGGFQKVTGHHAALYHSGANLIDACVEKAVGAFYGAGVPKEKLILGVPFYSRQWDGVKGEGCYHGLGMEAETIGAYGGDYGELKENWIGRRGFVRYWDDTAKVPYLFNGSTFVSYDDTESIGIKMDYMKEQGLGGVMFWEYKCDPSGELLHFIRQKMDGEREDR
ncbi:MAG: glycoside hydrolase family 18 protein [Fusicatenibacter sp.]|nr:glycoside hydrolase family 18 protein [Fusicatenibacter sp.]